MLVLLALVGCSAPDAPLPTYDPASPDLLDTPWPTDARLRADGTVDLTGFPNPGQLAMIDNYVALAGETVGYGNNGPFFVRFQAPIDTALLPTPGESVADGSTVLLVNVDSDSPGWGERVPLQWQFSEDATSYQPQNLLALAPVYGFPLRPSTTYALVVTTGLAGRHPDFAQVWRPDHPEHARFAPLADTLFFLGLEPRDVSVASVFTTGDPLEEMASIARFLREDVEVPDISQRVALYDQAIGYTVYKGHYESPLFQHGLRPYATSGGGFRFREDGKPEIAEWERLRMAICTPHDVSSPPPGGWPVVIQQHGTGGNFVSHCSGDSSLEVGSQVAKAGMISIGIDQPLHGERATGGTDPDLHTFNYANPESARANFRQGAIDAIFLARVLASRQTVFTLDDGTEIPLNPDKVFFVGHSQGGLTGSLALPFMGEDVTAAVISGAGGGLSITLVERKDPYDIADMVETVLQFGEGEQLTELHPVTAVIQQMVDVTDPLNYSPYWFAETGTWPGQAPTSVLLTSGMLDEQTPHRTAEALAAAARLPQLAPGVNQPEGLALRLIEPVPPPLAGNAIGFDGSTVTGAFSQWEGEDHWVIFDNRELADLYRGFLESAAADGMPRIESP